MAKTPFNIIKQTALEYILELGGLCEWNLASGIYFVIDVLTENVVYVGKSINLQQRLAQQMKRWPNHQFIWKPLDSSYESLLEEEAFWIIVLRPRENRNIKCRLNNNLGGELGKAKITNR